MTNLLSKDEVEALLKGMDSGEIETEPKPVPAGEIQPFDLISQKRAVPDRMAGLEMVNERFVRFFQGSIAGILMKSVEVTIRGYDLIKFGEVMSDLPHPTSINIFKMDPLNGFALVVIESPLVFAFVDQLFGGGNTPWVKSEGRYFTPIEQKIIKKIVDTALKDLGRAWQAVLPLEPNCVNSEMNPQFVTIVTPVETVIRIEIQIEIANFVGNLFFCFPLSLIEPVKDKLFFGIRHQVQTVDQKWISCLGEILKDSSVVLQVDIGSAELPLRELVHLEKGNVITLQTSVFDELTIRVEGVPKMKGTAGYFRGNQGIKITKFLENS